MRSNVASRSASASHEDDMILRYTLGERLNHWFGALTYAYLLITGLAFWSPYFFWLAALVGGGSTARFWHPWFGLAFSASLFWMFKDWRQDMRVDNSDRAWGRVISNYIRNEDDKLPPTTRFNYGQKLFFWGMCYSVILLLLSGVALWYTEALPWSLRYVRYTAILIHASVAFITIGLFLIHVYMSAILEKGSLASMIHGKVTAAWAWTFHRIWYDDLRGASRSKQ